jgi:hypothetical protein
MRAFALVRTIIRLALCLPFSVYAQVEDNPSDWRGEDSLPFQDWFDAHKDRLIKSIDYPPKGSQHP